MSRKKWSFVQKIELRSEKWLCHLQFLCNCSGFALVSGASAVGVSLLQDARTSFALVCFLVRASRVQIIPPRSTPWVIVGGTSYTYASAGIGAFV